jgi:hypothetical protein
MEQTEMSSIIEPQAIRITPVDIRCGSIRAGKLLSAFVLIDQMSEIQAEVFECDEKPDFQEITFQKLDSLRDRDIPESGFSSIPKLR